MLGWVVQAILNEIVELCQDATTEPTKTALPRVLMIQGEVPTHQLAAVYEPLIGLDAIQWIRQNFTDSFEIDQLANRACMGITTFHRQFKSITGLSPIQFQKQLRLLEARKLLTYSGYSVTDAALDVGYESTSQFNREYSRFFGASPAKDVKKLKEMEV